MSTNNVSKIQLGYDKTYDIKDSYSRTNKLDKNEDDIAYAIINFMNGIKVNQASIVYDENTNTITFS